MYNDFYGLHERPFRLIPDPDFIFWSDTHRAAFAILEYGMVSRAPITVLTGEIGVGKTTLLQHLLLSVGDDMAVGLISNAQGGRGELLRWVTNALSVESPMALDYVALYQRLQDHLLAEYAQGRRVTLVIDEAQNLSVEALEELRMMTNINSGKDELLQLILVGQPELRAMIMLPELQQFAQRIGAAYHLRAMDEEAVAGYIRYRMHHAGGTGDEFAPAAIVEIVRHSRGVPRLVNKLCDFCLVYGALSEERAISLETVRNVLADGIFITGFIEGDKAAE